MSIVDYRGAYSSFETTLSTVKRLQERVNADPSYLEDEKVLLFESVFMGAFKAFENFVEHCFVLSMQGEPSIDGIVIPRFVEPQSRKHAREMLLGAQTVLDWTSGTTILRRHETFLRGNDSKIYLGVSSVSTMLAQAKDLRNHIAHNSDESSSKYVKVVAAFLPTPPLTTPLPGELLGMSPPLGPAKGIQVLTYFRDRLAQAAKVISGAP